MSASSAPRAAAAAATAAPPVNATNIVYTDAMKLTLAKVVALKKAYLKSKVKGKKVAAQWTEVVVDLARSDSFDGVNIASVNPITVQARFKQYLKDVKEKFGIDNEAVNLSDRSDISDYDLLMINIAEDMNEKMKGIEIIRIGRAYGIKRITVTLFN
jgi:hypothetical protein